VTDRLSLYNGALLECGERDLASLTEAREPRRLLDRVWDNGAVDYCLWQGQWAFARRSTQLAPSASVTPGFGHSHAYLQPTDHIRTISLTTDEYGKVPLLDYVPEGDYWYTDAEPIYLSYVSNHASYGGDLTRWTAEFVRAVECYLAARIIKKLTQSEDKEAAMEKKAAMLFMRAASGDAMENPTKFPPSGSWVNSRRGSGGDRGKRSRLIG